ncbi:MAG TPA: myo-inositol 2-dehydrogenase [Colwellia sp.]|nr:myo-inositol 2-dehydrogenase [Colwellia sp.]|tara:strand:+ start:3999 stop:4937 length:939 start_codon:yes stop_codon:yes gene_type:complete
MIWLIGAGGMSVDYVKVLEAQNEKFIVIGRGGASANKFEKDTGKAVVTGGLESFLKTNPEKPTAVIVSVGVEQLYNTAMHLLEYGVKNILVEKPGGIQAKDIEHLKECCNNLHADIYVAYNRRFFSSVLKAQEMIKLDGGVTSFNFELTEWSHEIEKLDKNVDVLATWFLGNTTHVADLAFFLGGKPREISTYTSGGVAWHPSSSIFAGAGISESGALFNYGADWESAGRWSVEMLTKENRYIFRPMEALSVQKRGTIPQVAVKVNDELDKEYKPGLYLQVQAFLANDSASLCSIKEQYSLFSTYEQMAGYK